MTDRKGEKIGWIGGWLGGFIWLALLSIIWLFHNQIGGGVAGLVLFVVALISIVATSPWRHPNVAYWKLMLPMYVLLFIAISLTIYLLGSLGGMPLRWNSFLWLIPCLIPLVTNGKRTWKDNAKGYKPSSS